MKIIAATAIAFALGSGALAAQEITSPKVEATDQTVSNGIVSATKVIAPANGWLVVHRTDAEMKPGPVLGHAPLRNGETDDVAVILTEDVVSGDKLMLMVHGEEGGAAKGVFEYTLGAKEDAPIRLDGNLVATTITAK